MKLALAMIVCPFLMYGQEPLSAQRMPLDQVMEQFQTIDLEARDNAYRTVLIQMRRNGMPLESGIRRLINSHANRAIDRLKVGCGLSRREHADIELRVGEMLRDKRKLSAVQSMGLLHPDLEKYVADLFEQKKCKGILTFQCEPEGDLVRLDDDIHISKFEGTQKIRGYNYSKHTLVFNSQFTKLDPAIQRALIHLFICKIADGDGLRNKLLMQIFSAKSVALDGVQMCASSPAGQAYREYLMLRSIGQCVIDDPSLAAPLAALYDLYEREDRSATAGYRGSFNAMHAQCRDWAKRLLRFVMANERIIKNKTR